MDEKRRDQAIPLLGLAAIVATSLGYYLWLEPLKTFRPAVGDPPKPPLERNLPARLWQDPVDEARHSYAAANGKEPQGETGPIRLEPRDHLLIVQTYGGYSQLDHETRLRTRYAVGLALERAGFTPDSSDTEFLRFRAIQMPSDPARPGLQTAKVVPYEYWNPTLSRGDNCRTESEVRIVVLWVTDDIAMGSPLTSLQTVVGQVAVFPPGAKARPLSIIGPTSSGGLHSLMLEIEKTGLAPDRFNVYSPWATADDWLLLNRAPQPLVREIVHRTISDDRTVTGALLKELMERHIDLSPRSRDQIALVSEWDTEYGRLLPITFAACAQIQYHAQTHCDDLSDSNRTEFVETAIRMQKDPAFLPANLIRVSYLRGLDGIGPRSGPNKPEAASRTSSVERAKELERPDGSSQLDYTRRLVDEVARLAGSRLRAVGVLGGDIYDKLLLLQALSERLPGVIFFTTDLDASYLHESQLPWTQNLLVGSSYPLNKEDPGAAAKLTPPFRDVYGMSIYRATLEAVEPLSCRAAEVVDPSKKTKAAAPAVYEIGRTEAHRLGHQAWTFPQWLSDYSRFALWLLLAGLVFPALYVLMTGRPPWGLLLLAAAVGGAFSLLYVVFGRDESLHWMEGVSIWPSELCRLIASALAAFFLFSARRSLQRNRELICADFGCGQRAPFPPSYSRQWWRRFRQLLLRQWNVAVPVRELWYQYDEFDRPSYRYFRAGLLTVVTMAVAWLARHLEASMRPCRGTSCTADDLVSFVALLAQFLLLYVVVDVTLSCSRWIVALKDTRSRQSGASLEGYPEAWMEIELVARRTMEVSRLVLYPFLSLPLLILAQFPFFDDWSWPISLLLVYGGLLTMALAAALILRRCAESARARACEEVRALRVQAIESNHPDRAARMESALREIEAEARGAFSPLSQNPVLGAVLLPISGAGTGLALDSLLKSF